MKSLLILALALPLAAQEPAKDCGPALPKPCQVTLSPDEAKVMIQRQIEEIAALKQVNENLVKLLNWYKQQFMQMLEREILQPPTVAKQEPTK